jgi:DNA repair photolyase
MSLVEYREITCRSALNRVVGMPFRWSLNPYRGCAHACQYCYARATHGYLNLGVGRDFEQIIYVKTNVAEALRRDLASQGWRHESVAIGTATDPYQPAEGTFRLTRQCLTVLAEQANPCSITTKGTLVVRDLDVLSDLARATDLSVHVSLITLDLDLWKRIEPSAPIPKSRLRAIERLSAVGIQTSVFLMPVLPGLTDGPEQLASVIRAAADHGATRVISGPLRLAPGVKEWFFGFLQEQFPRLAASYERGYGPRTEVPGWYRVKLEDRIAVASKDVAFTALDSPRSAPRVGPQFALPL